MSTAKIDLQWYTNSTKLDVWIHMNTKLINFSSVIAVYVKWTQNEDGEFELFTVKLPPFIAISLIRPAMKIVISETLI